VLAHLNQGWPAKEIVGLFHLSTARFDAAVRYIEERKDEVMADYEEMLARDARESCGASSQARRRAQAIPGHGPRASRGQAAEGSGCGKFWRTLIRKALTSIRFIWLFSDAWREPWIGLDIAFEDFQTPGLPFEAPDQIMWRTCQREALILITGNRNNRGHESLEATIQNENQPDSLPVTTVANRNRVLQG
jgi:hypothetical protein